eukprot:TRINITY_DN71_c0_g2_i1.p1 TRINITY_DN71_c0_g2~~TRINITY_DN71_c0_g2_i1.p1  ORF type:complete len:1215 (+),score=425.35 TRINITY_DN71_c0_g2_i1:91-3645(+)
MPLLGPAAVPALPLLTQRAAPGDGIPRRHSGRRKAPQHAYTSRPPPPAVQQRSAAVTIPIGQLLRHPTRSPVSPSGADHAALSGSRRSTRPSASPSARASPWSPAGGMGGDFSAQSPSPPAAPPPSGSWRREPRSSSSSPFRQLRTRMAAEAAMHLAAPMASAAVQALAPNAVSRGKQEEAVLLRQLEDRQVVARERFIALMREAEPELKRFASAAVIGDVLLTQVAGATEGEPAPNALRISVACYVLDRLCESLGPAYAHTMQRVRDEIFSAVFAEPLSPTEGGVPAGSVCYGLSPEAAAAHRYVGRAMHFEHAVRFRTQLGRAARVCDGLSLSFAQHQQVLDRASRAWQRIWLGRVFWGWRCWHKRRMQERWVRDRRRGRFLADQERAMKEAVVLRWRLHVASERWRRLLERQDGLACQLANAKNQFQLQCFKTERYLITIEELRKQLSGVTRQLAAEKRKNVEACTLMGLKKAELAAELEAELQRVVRAIEDWAEFSRTAVAQATQNDVPDRRPEVTLVIDPKGRRGRASRVSVQSGASLERDALEQTQYLPPEQMLLRWANQLLKQSEVLPAGRKGPSNFAADWVDGEFLVVLLNQIAPSVCKLSLLQQTVPERRAEAIVAAMTQLRLPYIPAPGDICKGRSSAIYLTLAALFRAHASRQFDRQEHEHLCEQLKLQKEEEECLERERLAAEKAKAEAEAAERPEEGGQGAAPQPAASAESAEQEPADALLSPTAFPADPGEEDPLQKATPATEPIKGAECPKVTLATLDSHLVHVAARLELAKETLAQHRDHESRWQTAVREVDDEACGLLKQLAVGEEVEIRDPKEFLKYARIQRNRLKDVAQSYTISAQQAAAPQQAPVAFDTMLDGVQKIVVQNFGELRRIFKYYAALRDSTKPTMGAAEFWQFCKDSRAVHRDILTRRDVTQIFQQANAEGPGDFAPEVASADSESDVEDDENPDSELVPGEFVECLVRMADARVTSERQLQHRFELFLKEFVLPNAARADVRSFRSEVYEPSVQTVLRRYNNELLKVFRFYSSAAKTGDKKRIRVISQSEFALLLKDACLLNPPLDERAVRSVFSSMQSGSADAAEQRGEAEAAFSEFTELLVVVAVYRFPSPYIPLANRLEHLISAHMLPVLRPRLRQYGLKLQTDLRAVPLATAGAEPLSPGLESPRGARSFP